MVPLFLCYSLCCSFSPTGIEYSFNRPCQTAQTIYPPLILSSIDEFPTSKRYLDLIPHREGNESFFEKGTEPGGLERVRNRQSQNSRTHDAITGTNPFLLEEGYTHPGNPTDTGNSHNRQIWRDHYYGGRYSPPRH